LNGGFAVREYRDASGCGRNLSIEILEYFDRLRFTRRRDDRRIILNDGLPEELFSV